MTFLQSMSTRSLTPESRLDGWNRYVRQRFIGMRIDSVPTVEAQLLSCELGQTTVSLAQSQRATISRWDRQAPSSGGARRLLHLQHQGFSVTDQRGRCVPVAAGDLTHCIPDEPYSIQISDRNAMIVVDVAEHVVELGRDRTCDLVSGRVPAVGLLRDFTLSLLRQHWPDDVDGDETTMLEGAVIGLVRRCFRQTPALPWVTSPQDDRQRVLAFVEMRLEDSALRTADIARALALSVGAVQAIFVGMATTPTAYIINRRLSRAAEVLGAAPATSITNLAYDLGFSDAAHLCRRFKRRFGVSPGRFAHDRQLERH